MLECVWKLSYGHVFCDGMLMYHIFGFMKCSGEVDPLLTYFTDEMPATVM